MKEIQYNVDQSGCKKNADDTAECIYEYLKFGEANLRQDMIAFRQIGLTCGCLLFDQPEEEE